MPKIPDNLVPLIYLVVAAVIAAGLMLAKVPPEMVGLIVGAALTRVKVSPNGRAGAPDTQVTKARAKKGGTK